MIFTREYIQNLYWLNYLNYELWAQHRLSLNQAPNPSIYPDEDSYEYKLLDANRKSAIRGHNLVCKYLEKHPEMSMNNNVSGRRYYDIRRYAEKEFLGGMRCDFELIELQYEHALGVKVTSPSRLPTHAYIKGLGAAICERHRRNWRKK